MQENCVTWQVPVIPFVIDMLGTVTKVIWNSWKSEDE